MLYQASQDWICLISNQQTMIQRMLKISELGPVREASNKRLFRTVKFTPYNQLPDGTPVFSNQTAGTRNIFGPFEDKDSKFKADGLWNDIQSGNAKVGSAVEGYVAKVSTTPYIFGDSDVERTSYSSPIFSGEIETDYINKQLKEFYACVVLGDHVTAPDQLVRPVGSNAATSNKQTANAL